MRMLFLERLIANPLDNWLYDFENDWYKKHWLKKIFVWPLIFIFGDIRNIKRNK